MSVTKKHDASDKNLFSRLWNEFLFAREYEYESPLTPDEMMAALKAIESLEHGSWILSVAKLKHKLEIERHGDKAIDFKITLEEDKDSVWSSRMSLIYSEGSVNADPLTGLSVIKGRTRFSGQYYLIWAAVFAVNIFSYGFNTFSFGGELPWLSWFWMGFALLFWLAMYGERNALADCLDDIIMHAKIERSLAILQGETADEDDEEDLIEAEPS